MSPPSVWTRLFEAAKSDPDRIAYRPLGFDEPALGWGQWVRAACQGALQLRQACPEEAPVALMAPNGRAFLIGFVAAILADRPLLPLSPHLTDFELTQVLRRSNAHGLLGPQEKIDAVASELAFAMPLDQVPIEGTEAHVHEAREKFQKTGALYLQSSGTTGLPKIVNRSLASLDHVASNCVRAVGFDAQRRVLAALPLYHSYGIEHALLCPMLSGAEVWLMQRFDPGVALEAMGHHPIDLFPGVPFMFEALARVAEGTKPSHALRTAFSAGGPLPMQTHRRFKDVFDLSIGQLYGATEFGSITYGDAGKPNFDPMGVGLPMAGVTLRVVSPGGIEERLPVGEEGQVMVKAPSMLSHFVDDVAMPTVDGFFPSGDLGRLDAHGQLSITGRLKLLIDVGGMKVNLMEVESVLRQHPWVEEAVVLSMAVTENQSRLKAVVEPVSGQKLSVEALRDFAKERLIAYKVPRVIEICDALPRSPTGKVQRRELA